MGQLDVRAGEPQTPMPDRQTGVRLSDSLLRRGIFFRPGQLLVEATTRHTNTDAESSDTSECEIVRLKVAGHRRHRSTDAQYCQTDDSPV